MKKGILLISILLAGCSKANTSNQESLEKDVSSDILTTEEISSIEETSSEEEIVVPSKAKNITNYLGSDNDIYRINITTNDSAFPTDKENYVKVLTKE